MARRCSECRQRGDLRSTPSGRRLCAECWLRLTQFGAAGAAMVAGASPGRAVGTGLAAGGWADAVERERAAAAHRKAKLDRTRGFWRRLWVRIVG